MDATRAEWIDGKEAARILEVHRRHVPRLVEAGVLRPRPLPGVRARFSRAEVEALAKPPAVPDAPTA